MLNTCISFSIFVRMLQAHFLFSQLKDTGVCFDVFPTLLSFLRGYLAWCKAQVNVCYHYKSVSLFLLIIIPRTPTSHNKQLICHSMDFKTLLKAPCDIKYQGSSSRWSPSDACLPLCTF